MAKKALDFLKSLLVKAGGNPEDEKIKAALTGISAELELNEDVVTAIDNGLISIANAKNNHPEIKNHYFAQAYNGLDSELETLMQEEKLSEEVIAEIKGEKSSTKRAALLAKKIKQLEKEKASAGKTETKQLNEQITGLQEELRKTKESINDTKSDYEKKLREKDKSYAMRNILGAYKTIHDGMDAETKNIIINAVIDKNLRAKGYKIDTDENGNLKLTDNNGNNAFSDDHQVLTPKTFLDKVMADEKLLVVSDSNNQQNNNGNNTNNNGRNYNNGNNFNNNGFNRQQNNSNQNGNGNNSRQGAVIKELVDQAQRDLANSQKSTII